MRAPPTPQPMHPDVQILAPAASRPGSLGGTVAFLLALFVLGLAACAPRTAVDMTGVRFLHEYGWDFDLPHAEAAWNPIRDQLVVRSPAGFTLLEENSSRKDAYVSTERREMHYPCWLNSVQFVFGPGNNVQRMTDGSLIVPDDGLMVVTVGPEGTHSEPLAKSGYRPHRWHEGVVASVANHMVLYDRYGAATDLGDGFYPMPEADGKGLAWQDTPVIQPDYWTGRPVLGDLIIRWNGSRTTEVPHAILPTWTADGGVAAIALHRPPPALGPWWGAGSDVILIRSPGAKSVVIAPDAHEVAPNPRFEIFAVVRNDDHVDLVGAHGEQPFPVCEHGSHPAWSASGTQLSIEEPSRNGHQGGCRLEVKVFKIPVTDHE